MTVSIIAKNASQKITGSISGTGEITVTDVTSDFYTVPTGKIEKLHVIITFRTMVIANRVKVRANGILIHERGTGDTNPPSESVDLGQFILSSGQTLSVGSGGVAQNGARVLCTVATLESTPI